MKWACGAAGLKMAPPQFQASHLRLASLGFLIAPKPRASSEPLCTICDAERARKCILPAMQRPTADRRGNVCQFNAAGSNGSSISLPKRPAFALKLISGVSFPGSCQRCKLTVIQLTNRTPRYRGCRITLTAALHCSIFLNLLLQKSPSDLLFNHTQQ